MGILDLFSKKDNNSVNKVSKDHIGSLVQEYNRKNNISEEPNGGTDYKKLALTGSSDTLTADELSAYIHQGSENPDKDLNKLIGLSSVKEQIVLMKSRIQFYAEDGLKAETINGNHMCFYGPPGTGKTTVARIMAGILYKYGFIRKNQSLEIDGEFLKKNPSMAVKTTTKVLSRAMGGVLFIDEAYLLTSSSLGYEILGIILKAMEDARSEFIVIFAGYEREMSEFIAVNPGLKSRIKTELFFGNYNPNELGEIFIMMAKNNSYSFNVEDEALSILKEQFEFEAKRVDFGNARDCRNFLDKIIDEHTMRYVQNPSGDKNLITLEDVNAFLHKREEELQRQYMIQEIDDENWIVVPKFSKQY